MFKKVQNGSGPGGDDAAPKGDDPGQRASQGAPQRCGALRRTLARLAPTCASWAAWGPYRGQNATYNATHIGERHKEPQKAGVFQPSSPDIRSVF